MNIAEIMEREVRNETAKEEARRKDAEAVALRMRQEREDRLVGRCAAVVVAISAVVTVAVVIYKVMN